MTELNFALVASGGAVCQEVLYWFEKRKNLKEPDQKILKSTFYWVITILVIGISGLGTYWLFYDTPTVKPQIPFVLGAAFPYIFKKLVSVTKDKPVAHLGDKKVTFSTVFQRYFE